MPTNPQPVLLQPSRPRSLLIQSRQVLRLLETLPDRALNLLPSTHTNHNPPFSLPDSTPATTMALEILMVLRPLPKLLSRPSLTEQESKKTGKSINCNVLHLIIPTRPRLHEPIWYRAVPCWDELGWYQLLFTGSTTILCAGRRVFWLERKSFQVMGSIDSGLSEEKFSGLFGLSRFLRGKPQCGLGDQSACLPEETRYAAFNAHQHK